MKHLKILSGCLVAVFALAATASGASALTLKHEGTPLKAGAPLAGAVEIGECVVATKGTLGTNGKSSDKASFTVNEDEECSEGSISGKLTAVKLSGAGVMSFKAALTLKTAGPCGYAFKKFTSDFEPNGGVTFGSGEATGKLVKGESARTCAKTLTTEVSAGLITNISELEPFETES
ncbi:MAG TPA: hypothetical protein VK721_12955 [Solirubrobacteraceae bacterium]|nr:hypothetical protein [Solirubrobacteraceae bacterium]